MARAIMLQGTGSDVGKSLLVAGLCRAAVRRGLSVRPFKPQNMSNNAAVTADGGEIGRAQALQARAARVAPTVDMNPVLLKPQGGDGAQVVVQGRIRGAARAAQYQAMKPRLLAPVLESFARLKGAADLVLVEGAGSAAEVNLRAHDIANMGFSRAAGVPVVIVGDIDRGGVIASLVGTARLLDPADAALVVGFVVNRFRGDPALFEAGMARIEAETGWRSFGLVPHTDVARKLPAEDALALRQPGRRPNGARVVVAVPTLPSIANFDDLDPLEAEEDVAVVRVDPGEALPGDADLVILPGSKATLADLSVLRASGLAIDIAAHLRRGGHLLGICGGYQMMCRTLTDPSGIEGGPGEMEGLGLVPADTVLTAEKTLAAVTGRSFTGAPLSGYEMHLGRTVGDVRPFATVASPGGDPRPDGAVERGGRIVGTYVHGLFADDAQRADWLRRLGGDAAGLSYEAGVEEALDALADHLEAYLDVDALLAAAR